MHVKLRAILSLHISALILCVCAALAFPAQPTIELKHAPVDSRYCRKSLEIELACLNRELDVKPDDDFLYSERSFAKWRLDDRVGALKDINKAIELNPTYCNYYTTRSLFKEYDLADFSKAIALKPDRAMYYEFRAQCKCLDRDLFGALADFDKAVKLDGKTLPSCIESFFFYWFRTRDDLHKKWPCEE